MPSQKINIDGQVKEFTFADYADFIRQVDQMMYVNPSTSKTPQSTVSTSKITQSAISIQPPNITSYIIINPDSPWEEIKNDNQLSNMTTLTLVPIKQSHPNTQDTNLQPLSRSTLDHFIRTHEAKNEYFMNNPQYTEKLNMEVHHFIHTEKDLLLFEKFIDKLEKLSSQQSFLAKNNNYYLEWILNLTSLGSDLPTPLINRLKHLNHHIVDSILYNSSS